MGTILACGPVAATEKENKAYVVAVIGTRGDWIGTDEGQNELENAKTRIKAASDNGKLPKDTLFEWQSDDQAVIRIPCESWAEAMKQGPVMKALIPEITGAMPTDMIVRKR